MQFAIWTLLAIITFTYSNGIEGSEVCRSKVFQECRADVSKVKPPANCSEALKQSGRKSGVHRIKIPGSKLGPFFVNCIVKPGETTDSAWTLLMRRMNGKISFSRPWKEYQQGFGNMEADFFLGLDKIHALTQSTLHELWIELEDMDSEKRSAHYTAFGIGNNEESYEINLLGDYTGNAGDALSYHVGAKFSAPDTDAAKGLKKSCAIYFKSGWWYKNCHKSHLTGHYLINSFQTGKIGRGIVWVPFHGMKYSMKYAHMAIRALS